MRLINSNVFMGHTFFKYDEPILMKNIKSIKIDGKNYMALFPYDMPYTIMIVGEISTVGKSVELVYYSDEEQKALEI